MKEWKSIQERDRRNRLPVRLRGLAANLRRIKSFAAQEANGDAVVSLIEESKYFIEWTAPDAQTENAEQLVNLQVQLAGWQRNWSRIWSDPSRRKQMAEQSQVWSDQVLALSGLLQTGPA